MEVVLCAAFYVQLDVPLLKCLCSSALMHRYDVIWIPATGFDPVSSWLWATRAAAAPCRFESCSSALMHRCDDTYTSWGFWSADLRIMSPALCRWAKGVWKLLQCLDAPMRSGVIPATGFDPVSSELWALRASSAPCRWKMLRLASSLTSGSYVLLRPLSSFCKAAELNCFPQSVSIWRPPAHKAITINRSDLMKV